MKRLVVASLLLLSPASAGQPDDTLWQQFVGTREAQCAQALVDSAREVNRLRDQVAELQKQLKAKDAGGK